jgi:diguanylate cyclase (GGDEF)-like protein
MFTAYLVVMGVAIGGFVAAPDTGYLRMSWQVGVGVLAAVSTVLGARRHQAPGGAAWVFFAVGILLNSGGTVVEDIVYRLDPQASYPTIADGFWLALYPCLVAGMVIVHRHRTRSKDWSATLDTATITTGVGLLCWVYVIRPATHDEWLTVLGHAVVAAYPIGDIVVLAMLTRLVLGGAGRLPSLRFLIAAAVTLLVGDMLWNVWSELDIEIVGVPSKLMNMIFMTAFALVGASALHPTVRQVAAPSDVAERRVGNSLLAALALAALIAPIVQIGQALTGEVVDGVATGISSMALFLLVVLRFAGLLRQVDKQARQLRELARIDALTGLPNRRAWSAELPAVLERARRDRRPLTVAMIDLDHFKQFNDNFGHPAGDRLLKSAAAAWQEKVRAVDVLARYGGEEFILLLPDADVDEAIGLIERLREGTPLGQRFSAGVALWDQTETSDELVNRADQALYQAKREGRNRTTTSRTTSAPLTA